MRRLIFGLIVSSLIGILVIIATSSRAGQAQETALPTPKGQLGGAVRLTTPPVVPPMIVTATPAATAIVGSWLVTVSPIPGAPVSSPAAAAAPPLLLTFAADGTLTGAAGTSAGSSLHGAWGTAGNGSVYLRALWLTFAANGAYASTVELTGTVHLAANGNGWDGQVVAQELRPHGRMIGMFDAHGTRITAQPGPLQPPYATTPTP